MPNRGNRESQGGSRMVGHFSEADTRAKLIDPALHKHGWTEA